MKYNLFIKDHYRVMFVHFFEQDIFKRWFNVKYNKKH